jgi:hypothetical protein
MRRIISSPTSRSMASCVARRAAGRFEKRFRLWRVV